MTDRSSKLILDKIIRVHEKDFDLSEHVIGTKSDCFYCKEYIKNIMGTCTPKKKLNYIHYIQGSIHKVREFCFPNEVVETKVFKKTGRIAAAFPKGNVAINLNDYIIRVTDESYLVFSQEDFERLFKY